MWMTITLFLNSEISFLTVYFDGISPISLKIVSDLTLFTIVLGSAGIELIFTSC